MDKTEDFKNTLFQGLGQASMAWSETPNGVFDSDLCKRVGERITVEHEIGVRTKVLGFMKNSDYAISRLLDIARSPKEPNEEEIAELIAGYNQVKREFEELSQPLMVRPTEQMSMFNPTSKM